MHEQREWECVRPESETPRWSWEGAAAPAPETDGVSAARGGGGGGFAAGGEEAAEGRTLPETRRKAWPMLLTKLEKIF